jgi:hypothetical protein
VRRVKRIQQQAELFSVYRHHAVVTNRTLSVVEADDSHRDHAVVEQVIAGPKDGPLAHLPSGKYPANAAWRALAVIAFNLARVAATAAGIRKARWATLRRRIIDIPARIATTSRTQSRSNQVVRRSEAPHRWIQAQSTVSSGISGSTPRDAIAGIQPVRDSDRTAPLADYCPLPATPSAATKRSVRTGSGTRSSQISRQ